MALMGLADSIGKQLGMHKSDIVAIRDKMRSSESYSKLLCTLQQSFPYIDIRFKGDPRTHSELVECYMAMGNTESTAISMADEDGQYQDDEEMEG